MMKHSAKARTLLKLALLALIGSVAAAGCSAGRQAAGTSASILQSDAFANIERAVAYDIGTVSLPKPGVLDSSDAEPYYADRALEWKKAGYREAGLSVRIDASKPSGVSPDTQATAGSYEGRDGVLRWEAKQDSWVEYRVEVPASGLYEIQADYRPVTGEGHKSPILLDVTLDGEHPFREASSITLYREWTDARPIKTNEIGEEIRPRSIDISEWRSVSFADSRAAYAVPFRWYLGEGSHVIRLQGDEPVALASLTLKPPSELPLYEEAASRYPAAAEDSATSAGVVKLEAEAFASKNDPAVQVAYDTDMRTVPVTHGRIVFNTLGGARWNEPNQQVTWTFDVPEDGTYKIALRTLQNQFSQKASFRRIEIDGEVPFAEFLYYQFPFGSDWKGTVLSREDGEPYLIYLKKGQHTLSLAGTNAPVSPIVRGIDDLTSLLRSVEDDLLALTGGIEDSNRTWRVRSELPDLPDRLAKAADRLQTLSELMAAANGRKDSISQGLGSGAADLRTLLKREDDIPRHIDDITSLEARLAGYIVNLYKQPLQIDQLYVAPASAQWPSMKATAFQKAKGVAKNFYYSFDDTDSISKQDDKVLNVWVQRGRDYITELQTLADETFTPETGIRVKVNLLANPELLVLSNAAGLQPDVALGLSQDLPVDYAIRGSLHDLSRFPDFKDVYEQYSPGSWLSVYYNKGYYAVPETQSFQVLYYRKDILRKLGIAIPETWEELYALLPTLQESYKNFYYDWNQFIPFFNQRGVEFFSPDGLRTSIDSPEGFAAFRQWTELFGTYAVDQVVPSFYEHFRDGTMPLGISDYNMYVQLSAAAPELNGRWGIAPIPGVKEEDGTITRWAGGEQHMGVIFENSDKKDQAWTFLKWWLSTETQVRYGADLEAMNGVSFRWNTANIDAFVQLPWKKEDAEVILQAWAWYKEKPNLPGGYLLGRELRNAWVRTAVDGMNYRSSMEATVVDVNRELRRKQEEFGFIDHEGKILKHMDIPDVTEPWKGVDRYLE